jgi:hypothetical protein
MSAASATERRRCEHLLPGGHRLFKNVLFDILMQRVVITDVTLVGHATVSMSEVLSECEKSGSIAQRDETSKRLATLMGRQCPTCTLVNRQL